jgi:hypothetical protein
LVGTYENILKKVQDQAESQVVVEETMQGISIVKVANEWYEIARYKDRITEVVKLRLKGTT